MLNLIAVLAGLLAAGPVRPPAAAITPARSSAQGLERRQAVAGAARQADSVVLRVVTTNDFHGALLPQRPSWSNGREVGGAAAIAGMMDRLQRECGCAEIRVDAGDVMQGTPISNLSHGRATVEAYNLMGYAAAAVGNHEFDWTVDTLSARMREARFGWLAANIRTTAGTRPAWVQPWRMVRAGALKVALIGYASILTPSTTRPDNVAALRFDGGAAIVDSLVGVARRDSAADVVIVLAHEGGFCGQGGTDCHGEVFDLAAALTVKPDLIVSGHTHSLVNAVANGIPIVQARSSGTAVGIVDFVAAPGGGRTAHVRVETVYADRERADTAVVRLIDGYRRSTDALTSRPVATLASALRRGEDQYPLGNLLADAYRAAAGADAGIVNNGGIRADLDSGVVTWGALFQVVPFQNFVTRVTLTGADLRAALEHAVGSQDAAAHVSGVRLTASRGAPEGRRITALAFENGRPVRDDAHYTLAVPDYLASGGSGYAMLRGRPAVNVGVTDLDAFIAYLRRLPQPVRAPAEVRITGQ
ncbi:MAG: 5'-nucleotidase C-terminal domain-containing protein, partial [Gemmatimonadales bacterium]|jgi:5'-nucleotidase